MATDESLKIDGSDTVLSFTHIGKGLVVTNGELTDFVIAASDKKFVLSKSHHKR